MRCDAMRFDAEVECDEKNPYLEDITNKQIDKAGGYSFNLDDQPISASGLLLSFLSGNSR